MEWTGWIPFDELPHVYDPPDHFIVTANHRPAPPDYPYHIALEYPDPYRAQRITDRLRDRTRLTVDDFRDIQADTVSLHAKALLPLLIQHARPESDADRRAIELLRQWNFNASADSAAEPIFQAWFLRLAAALAGDELGPVDSRRLPGTLLLHHTIRHEHARRGRQPVVRRRDDHWTRDVRAGDHARAPRGRGGPDGTPRRRHDALAMGRRPPRRVSAPGSRLGGCAAPAAQPIDPQRRRLEHGQRRHGPRRSALHAGSDPRLSADRRSLTRQQQPLHRRGRPVGSLPVARTTTTS